MTFVVPFDGSNLAEAALVRAVEYGTALQEDIAAVTVVPERKGYARQKGWIEEGEAYDVEAVVESLRERVRSLAPDASFEYERIRGVPAGSATRRTRRTTGQSARSERRLPRQ